MIPRKLYRIELEKKDRILGLLYAAYPGLNAHRLLTGDEPFSPLWATIKLSESEFDKIYSRGYVCIPIDNDVKSNHRLTGVD